MLNEITVSLSWLARACRQGFRCWLRPLIPWQASGRICGVVEKLLCKSDYPAFRRLQISVLCIAESLVRLSSLINTIPQQAIYQDYETQRFSYTKRKGYPGKPGYPPEILAREFGRETNCAFRRKT